MNQSIFAKNCNNGDVYASISRKIFLKYSIHSWYKPKIVLQIFGYVQANGNFVKPNIECTSPGYVCDGTQTSYNCQLETDGSYTLQKIEDCTENSAVCQQKTGLCIKPADNSGYKFKCQQIGMFPDAFSCQKYYVCDRDESGNIVSKEYTCPNMAYNLKTGTCRNYIGNCEANLKSCERIGEIGRVAKMDRMYYICLPSEGSGVFPQIFMCPDGEYFINNQCQVPDEGLDEEGMCREAGEFYNPSSCNTYTVCSGVGAQPKFTGCSCNGRFDPVLGNCSGSRC